MAKTRPFSRHTDGPLSNFTEQVGNLYFGNDNTLFEVGGLKWWNGPDEDNGYVIAFEDAQGSHTGADGEPAFLGFKRSSQKTEASFLLLTRKVTGQTFTTGAEAKAYLNANGMWTSYGLEIIEPTATPQPTATPEPTLEPTATEVAPTATPEPTATEIAPTATQSPVPTSTPLAIQLIQRITSSLYTDVNAQGKSAAQLNAYLCQGIPYSWSSNTLYTSGNATPQDGDVIVYSNGLPFSNQQRLVVVGYTGTVTNWYRVATDINGVATVTQMSPCATATPEPTATEVAPTATPEPTLEPTATEVAPTATPEPTLEPTATEVAPTATPEPTATEVAPTATPAPTATAAAPSGFTVTIDEVGSDVVMTATGSLNINGLTLAQSNIGPFTGAGFGINTATYVLGTTPINYDSYTGFDTYPTTFGSYNGLPPESSSGDIFGVIMQGAPPYMLVVPVGYQSGDQISSSQTFENKTLSSLGLTNGTYTYTWGTGANAETFDVVIGSGAGNGGGGETPATIDETLYWNYGDPFNISLAYNATATGGNGVSMVNGFYFNKFSSDINGNFVGDQTSFLTSLPAGTLISYSNTVNPSVYNGIYEVVSVGQFSNGVIVNVTFVSTTYQFGSLQNGIAEFHFYSPSTSGSGEWYFYAPEGELTVGPPTLDGQAIFTDNNPSGGTISTFNPNKNTGLDYLNFNLSDSNGTDYTSQFTDLQTNGGTISVTQNGVTATYTLAQGMAFVQNPQGFAVINTAAATQTVTAATPFVYGDPISIAFN